MAAYLYLLLAIFGEVIGTSALKASEGFTRPLPAIMAVLGYGVTLWALSITLKTLPVGIVYAIWSGLGIISIIIIGIIYFGESFTFLHFIGSTFILSGVVLLMFLTGSEKSGDENIIAHNEIEQENKNDQH